MGNKIDRKKVAKNYHDYKIDEIEKQIAETLKEPKEKDILFKNQNINKIRKELKRKKTFKFKDPQFKPNISSILDNQNSDFQNCLTRCLLSTPEELKEKIVWQRINVSIYFKLF
jgi:hypothetical protein